MGGGDLASGLYGGLGTFSWVCYAARMAMRFGLVLRGC